MGKRVKDKPYVPFEGKEMYLNVIVEEDTAKALKIQAILMDKTLARLVGRLLKELCVEKKWMVGK